MEYSNHFALTFDQHGRHIESWCRLRVVGGMDARIRDHRRAAAVRRMRLFHESRRMIVRQPNFVRGPPIADVPEQVVPAPLGSEHVCGQLPETAGHHALPLADGRRCQDALSRFRVRVAQVRQRRPRPFVNSRRRTIFQRACVVCKKMASYSARSHVTIILRTFK